MSGFGTPGKCVAEFNLGKKRPCDQNASPNADRRMPGKGSADAKMHARTHTAEMYQCCAPTPFSLRACPHLFEKTRSRFNGQLLPSRNVLSRWAAPGSSQWPAWPWHQERNSNSHGHKVANHSDEELVELLACTCTRTRTHATTPPRTNAHTNKGGDKKTASQTIGLLTQYCA